jgi:integrase core domain protein
LPEKLSRNTKQHEARENKRNLGKSIEERPETVDLREEFGHWEIDSVLGKKNENEPAIISL